MEFSEFAEIEEIIYRSLTDSATRDELMKLKKWRSLEAHNDASYRLMLNVWSEKSPESLHPNYQTLENTIWKAAFAEGQDQDIEPKSNWSNLFYRIAAAVILVAAVSWFVLNTAPEQQVAPTTPEQITTYNPTGHKSKITLPDKSVIYLNSESTLTYQKGFSDSIRYIQLDGEAYFEVEPDANRPFVVETGGISTVALGTSFNIRNYPEESSIKISLLSGKVRVTDSQASNEVLLEPLEQVKFLKDSRTLKMTQMEDDLVVLWKDGIIHFKGSTFGEVIKTLERSYDVVIDTTDYTAKDWSYTGKFDNMSLEIVLTRIGYSEGFNFDIDGRNITLSDDS